MIDISAFVPAWGSLLEGIGRCNFVGGLHVVLPILLYLNSLLGHPAHRRGANEINAHNAWVD